MSLLICEDCLEEATIHFKTESAFCQHHYWFCSSTGRAKKRRKEHDYSLHEEDLCHDCLAARLDEGNQWNQSVLEAHELSIKRVAFQRCLPVDTGRVILSFLERPKICECAVSVEQM